MPMFDFRCNTSGCTRAGAVHESFLRSHADSNPACEACGLALERLLSAPNLVWLKPWGLYGGGSEEGISVTRTRSTRHKDGTPEVCRLTSHQEVRDYCRAEGLRMPTDINSGARVKKGGKGLETVGMPGCEV